MSATDESFAEWLLRMRDASGLTQRELAAEAGVSWGQISKYESGINVPRRAVMVRIKAFMNQQSISTRGEEKVSNAEQKPLNTMSIGMWPMNYGSKLVKEAADVLFSLGVDDRGSVESRLDAMEKTIGALRASMDELQGPSERQGES